MSRGRRTLWLLDNMITLEDPKREPEAVGALFNVAEWHFTDRREYPEPERVDLAAAEIVRSVLRSHWNRGDKEEMP